MALTKVTGDFIKAGSITQGHLHSSHGITTSHIAEGDKLFFTNARVDSRVGSLSTSNLSEGSNLYYTDARARGAISVSGNALSYNSSTGVITSNFEESPVFTGNVESQDTFILNYNNAGNKWQQLFDGSNGWNLRYYNGSSWSSNYINVNTSGNATFAGSISSGADIFIPVGEALFFGASEHTYIMEDVDDRLRFFVGGAEFMRFTEGTTDTIDFYTNATFSGNATIETGINLESGVLVIKNATGDSNGLRIFQDSSDASKIYNNYNGTLQLGVGNTTAITIDSSENTTFAGDITVSGGDITLGGTGRIQGIDTVSAGTDAANKTYVDNQVAGIVDSAPSTLDTLNELAAALGDDANFSTTVTNSIATKLPLAGGTLTGALNGTTATFSGIGQFAGAIRITENGTAQHILIGNQDSGGVNKPGMIRSANASLEFGYGNSWSGEGGTMTTTLTLHSNSNATFAGTITASGGNSTQWNTAYGWGDHASGGYAADNAVMKLTGNQTISGTKTFSNASIVISGTHGTISFMDTTSGEDNFYLHANSNNFYILADRDGTDTIDGGYETPHPLQLEGDTNTAYVFGSALNIGNWNTAYGWGDHGAAGYLTSYTETDTLATVTGRGASTSSVVTLTGGSKIVVQGSTDGGASRGIFMWNNTDSNWGIYMSTPGSTNNIGGGTAPSGLNGETSHSIRFRIASNASNGFIWENHNNAALMSLRGSAGDLITSSSMRSPIFYDSNNTAYYVNPADNSELSTATFTLNANSTISLVAAGTNASQIKAGAGDELYLGGNNTWQMRLSGGNILMDNGGYALSNGSMRAPIFYSSSDTSYYLYPNNQLSLKVYGEICNSNVYQGNLQPGALNLGRTDTDYRWNGTTWASDVRLGMLLNCADYYEIGVHDSGEAVHSFTYYNGNDFEMGRDIGWGTTHFTFTESVRSPIFYDSNNTAYYNDPASTSNVNIIQANRVITSEINNTDIWEGDITINGSSNTYYPVGWYGGEQTQVVEIEVFRNYNETAPNDWYSSTHKGSIICKIRTNFGGWGGAQYDWALEEFRETYSTQLAWAGHFANSRAFGLKLRGGGALYHVRIKGRSVAPTVNLGTWDPGGNSTGISSTTSVDSTLLGKRNHTRGNIVYSDGVTVLHEGSTAQTKSGTLQSNADFRAPIFYDSDDTAYYVNPATSSLLKGVQINTTASGAGSSLKIYTTTQHQYPQIYSNANLEAMWNYKNPSAEWYVGIRTSSQLVGASGFHFYNTTSAQTVGGWDINGHSYSISSSRAPIFYDSNDTNSYFDANRIIMRGGDPTIIMRDTNHNSAMMHVNSNRWYVLRGANDSTSWATTNGHWPLYIELDTNDAYFGRHLYSLSSMRSPIFYDRDNTAYYADPASLSSMHSLKLIKHQNHTPRWDFSAYVVESPHHYSTSGSGAMYVGETNTIYLRTTAISTGDHRAPIYYDYTNTGYYVNPDSTSNLNAATFAGTVIGQNAYFNQSVGIGFTSGNIGGRINIKNSAAGQIAAKLELGSSSNGSTIGTFIHTGASYASAGMFLNFQSNHISGDDNVLICYLDGDLVNKNNSYTQYSDERLKENIVDATPKLNEIKQIKVRNFNFKGEDLKQIGVVAQELEPIFPALVKEREVPGHEEPIKTVKYSVLVPILIKAMQEQQTIIDDLKSRLETLENQ